MTTRNSEMTVHPSLGGLDISSDPTVLDPNFLTVADNVEYREGGQRKRRPGFRVYSSDPTAIAVPAGSTWTHEAATRSNSTFAAASVYYDDLTVYAFHRYDGAVLNPMQYDLSVDGGKTFPTMRATTFNPPAEVATARYISSLTRFILLINDSVGIAYSDNVISLPSASTWTQVTPAGSVGAPIGMDVNGSNVVYAGQSGGATLNMAFSTNGGTTFAASATNPVESVTTPFSYQVFASPVAGTWCFISPTTGKIYRSTDSGNNWSASVKTITAGDAALSANAVILAANTTRMVAVYKGQVATSDDAGLTWTDRQNLTLVGSSPTSVQQASIVGLCNFGVPTSTPVLGGMTTYLSSVPVGTTAQAAWLSLDSGTTWTIKSVVGGASHGSPTVKMNGCIARSGRGVTDLANPGAGPNRDSWYSLSPVPVPIVSSLASVRALQDYWKYGASLVPTQQYIAVAGASIFASTGQGSWSALTVSSSFGSDSNRTTNITLAGDYAVISDGVSPPVAYDQTSISSTSLVQPQNVASNLARTVSLASTNPMVITTTNLFTFTSTLGFVTISSTGDLIMTTTSTLTNASTSPSVIFSSTSPIKATPASPITTTFGLTTTTPILFTPSPLSTMFFQSLVNGWSSAGATTATYTSTNNYSAWPKFTHSSYHLNRLFYQGISTAPSDVGYTAASNIMDSTGSDTGTFPVGTGDGDQVMALSRPFYGSLYVYKGPQFGSIWQLSGNLPATFAMVQVGYGAPILNARALVTTPTDIYWLSQYGVHSLQTTVKFGNVEEAFLSLPIQRLWRDRILKRTTLNEAWGFWHPQRNIVGWGVQPEGESSQHWLLCYNYALSDPKPGGKKFWSIWKVSGFSTLCGAIMAVTSLDADHTGDPHLYVGGKDGIVYEGDQEDADTDFYDAGTAYAVEIKTPKITRFKTRTAGEIPETQEKSFVGVVTYFSPKGSDAQATMTVTVDRRSQTYTVPFSGGGETLT